MNLQISLPKVLCALEKERKKKNGGCNNSCGWILLRILSDNIASRATRSYIICSKLSPLGAVCSMKSRNAQCVFTYLDRARLQKAVFWKKVGWKRALSSFWLMLNMRQTGAIFILIMFATCYNRRLRNIRMEGEWVARKWDMSSLERNFNSSSTIVASPKRLPAFLIPRVAKIFLELCIIDRVKSA